MAVQAAPGVLSPVRWLKMPLKRLPTASKDVRLADGLSFDILQPGCECVESEAAPIAGGTVAPRGVKQPAAVVGALSDTPGSLAPSIPPRVRTPPVEHRLRTVERTFIVELAAEATSDGLLSVEEHTLVALVKPQTAPRERRRTFSRLSCS